jgi:polyisoprenoid-binding protein YceI
VHITYIGAPVFKKQLTLLLLVTSSVVYAEETYNIDSRHTKPSFEINHLGFTTQRGRFNGVSGVITIDEAANTGHARVVIDTSTIDMGLELWNEHLRSPSYFDVKRYPTMTFESSSFGFVNGQLATVDGSLTLLGVSKPIRLQVEQFRCGTNPITKVIMCGANVTAAIRRSEFGMTDSIGVVGDDVRLMIPIEAYKVSPNTSDSPH